MSVDSLSERDAIRFVTILGDIVRLKLDIADGHIASVVPVQSDAVGKRETDAIRQASSMATQVKDSTMNKQVGIQSANGFTVEVTHLEDGGVLLVFMDNRLGVPMPPIRFTAGGADQLRAAVAKEDA